MIQKIVAASDRRDSSKSFSNSLDGPEETYSLKKAEVQTIRTMTKGGSTTVHKAIVTH
jgi:hypothetical protein